MNPNELQHTKIRPSRGWFEIDWHELIHYRDLIFLLVYRDLVAVYKQTILGPLWFVIQPLVSALVFTVIFGNVAQISTDGMPKLLFYMSGIVLWNYFQSIMGQVAGSLISNASLFRKVYYPRLVNPLASVISNFAQLALNISMFALFYFYYLAFTDTAVRPSWVMLALPLLIVQSAAIGLGTGLCLAALTAKYRDLTFALSFIAQIWMYATPIVYPSSLIPEAWRWVMMLNPMASVVELCRMALLGVGTVSAPQVFSGLLVTCFLLAAGLVSFHRVQRTFVDTI